MHKSCRAIFLLSIFIVFAFFESPIEASDEKITIFENVHILPMTGEGIQDGQALVVKGSTIQGFIPQEEIKNYPGANVIDGNNGYLIPGLVDSHIHNRTSADFLNYMYFGVTTVVGLGQGDTSLENMKAKRDAIERGPALGPKIYTAGQTIANHIQISDPLEAKAFVRKQKQEGLDLIKVYNNIPKKVFDAVVEEADAQGFSVFGHLPRTFSVEYALANGLDVVAHAEEFYFAYFGGVRDQDFDTFQASQVPDLSKAERVLDLMAENEVALIPNLIFTFEGMKFWDDTKSFMSEPEIKFLHPDLRENWVNSNNVAPRRKNVRLRILRERIKYSFIHEFTRRAHERGILLVAGTDAPLPGLYPGKSLHGEIKELVKSGLTYYEALATATSNASIFIQKYIDKNSRVGLIKPGFEADLILLQKNPLEDIRNIDEIEGVMIDGVWFNIEELDDLRAKMVQAFNEKS